MTSSRPSHSGVAVGDEAEAEAEEGAEAEAGDAGTSAMTEEAVATATLWLERTMKEAQDP